MPQTPDHAIEVRGLTKAFNGRTVLDGVDLDVLAGRTTVIMGGSGSGKSTLLRCMIGSIHPDSGSVRLLGRPVDPDDAPALDAVRKQIGVLFQSGALFNSMTLRDNVALPLAEHTDLPPTTIEIMVKIKLELVGLREHADKYPAQISGGMKKRAGLARALALDPKILFYDEPSAGLDPVTSAQIDQLITRLTRQLGVTSVVVTHEMDSAFAIADRMAMLDRGRMIAVDDKAYFEHLRDLPAEHHPMNDRERLIRQFLRGDAQGPITDRREASGYAHDLLGEPPGKAPARPAMRSTR